MKGNRLVKGGDPMKTRSQKRRDKKLKLNKSKRVVRLKKRLGRINALKSAKQVDVHSTAIMESYALRRRQERKEEKEREGREAEAEGEGSPSPKNTANKNNNRDSGKRAAASSGRGDGDRAVHRPPSRAAAPRGAEASSGKSKPAAGAQTAKSEPKRSTKVITRSLY